MKKIICLLAIAFCCSSLFAQDSSMNTNMNNSSMNMQKGMKMHDGVCMKDGKMMKTENGKMTMMDNDMTLNDGTTVMTDGTVKMKNGSTKMMKEGDMITMSGKWMNHDKMMKNKMMKDSMQ